MLEYGLYANCRIREHAEWCDAVIGTYQWVDAWHV